MVTFGASVLVAGSWDRTDQIQSYRCGVVPSAAEATVKHVSCHENHENHVLSTLKNIDIK